MRSVMANLLFRRLTDRSDRSLDLDHIAASAIWSRTPAIVCRFVEHARATTFAPAPITPLTNSAPAGTLNSPCRDYCASAVLSRPSPVGISPHSRSCICATREGERSIFAPARIVRQRCPKRPRHCSTSLGNGICRRTVSKISGAFSPVWRRPGTNCAPTTTRSISSLAVTMQRTVPGSLTGSFRKERRLLR